MKSIKAILCISGVVAVLVGQVAYLMTTYKEEQGYLKASQEELRLTQRRFEQLQVQVNQLPETKRELELVTSEKEALLGMVPSFTSGSKEGIELLRYMNMNDFMDTKFKVMETEVLSGLGEEETKLIDDKIIRRRYELTFVGRYRDVQSFIDHLNGSYQMIHIESMEMDNSVQKLEEKENLPYYLYYKDDLNQIVKVALQLTMYTRHNQDAVDTEIYQPDLNMRTNQKNVFSLIQETNQEANALMSQDKDLFTLLVGDILTSGDTYKLDGPGEKDEGYVGLMSEVSVEIYLVIRADGYEAKIKDAKGQEETISVLEAIENPEMSIISTMRPINEVMPSVHIYVDNQTHQEMVTYLEGSLTDHITVYAGNGKQVSKGQVEGKVRLV